MQQNTSFERRKFKVAQKNVNFAVRSEVDLSEARKRMQNTYLFLVEVVLDTI